MVGPAGCTRSTTRTFAWLAPAIGVGVDRHLPRGARFTGFPRSGARRRGHALRADERSGAASSSRAGRSDGRGVGAASCAGVSDSGSCWASSGVVASALEVSEDYAAADAEQRGRNPGLPCCALVTLLLITRRDQAAGPAAPDQAVVPRPDRRPTGARRDGRASAPGPCSTSASTTSTTCARPRERAASND